MRILDRSKISYEYQTYECDNFTDGISTADTLGLPHERVYKTLVTTGKSGSHYVFVIPIEAELDLKKSSPGSRRKVCGNAPCQRDHNCDRVCTGRLYRDRYEKSISDNHSGERPNAGLYLCQRRKAWNAAEAFSG